MMQKNRRTVQYDAQHPLVSVLVFNFNYGRFLRECLESILNQSYPNIEICFSDNCSSDDSWQIALEYQRAYPEVISLAENRVNLGAHANLVNCSYFKSGKYNIQMCSDDVMEPDYIERAVRALEANPGCGFAMVNRSIIDADGVKTPEPPFYNHSCIIPGVGQASVYMVAAVNPSVSQVVYVSSRSAVFGGTVAQQLSGRWFGNRLLDFNLCCNYDMIYLKEPLLRHRLHGNNDSLQAAGNLIEIIGPLLLTQQFAETAMVYGLEPVSRRLPEAKQKLSSLCLRYCARFLVDGEEEIAKQYFHLAAALSLTTKADPLYGKIDCYWDSPVAQRRQICADLQQEKNLMTRKVSHDPPTGSIGLED